jgi:uncharacterized protein YndB with AHSA1/START domain
MTMAAPADTTLVLNATSEREVVGTRVFDAPRELVFRAFTDPTLVPRWWSPYQATTVERMDVRVGGTWRYIDRLPNGEELAFSGEYREVTPPARIARTFNFELIGPGHEAVETIVLEELEDGRTRMTNIMTFLSVQDRDGMLESGMETGYTKSLLQLAELLEELKEAG